MDNYYEGAMYDSFAAAIGAAVALIADDDEDQEATAPVQQPEEDYAEDSEDKSDVDEPPLPFQKPTGRQWVELTLRDRKSCKHNFRMCRQAFLDLHDILVQECGLESSQNVESIEVLGMFVWACANRKSARGIADTFHRSLDTIHRKMAHVADVMLRFADRVICPKDRSYPTVSPKVARWSPFFDGCIGAIDGTHIKIRPKKASREDMLNRKGWASFNVCAIVDHDMRFTFVGAGMSGACHDMAVLTECQRYDNFPEPPPGMYYAADSGYKLTHGYLTPYKNTRYHLQQFVKVGPTSWEEKFNHDHASIRNVVERTFGVIKSRWHILDGIPFYKSGTQSKIIIACCAVNNFLVDRKLARHPQEQGLPQNRDFLNFCAGMPVEEMRNWITAGVYYVPI